MQVLLLLLMAILLVGALGFIRLATLIDTYYNCSSFTSILYHLTISTEGTDEAILQSYYKCFTQPLACVALLFLVAFLLYFLLKRWLGLKVPKRFYTLVTVVSLLFFGVSLVYALQKVHFFEYCLGRTVDSKWIEENYVSPEDVRITPPAQKRNLIVVYLESMESSYSSMDVNYIPCLTRIAKENTNFSDDADLGGPIRMNGAGWTTAGIITTTAGIPILTPLKAEQINEHHPYSYPHVVTLLDLLQREGYREKFVLGSEVQFGGMESYFTAHGRFVLDDVKTIEQRLTLSDDDYAGWGVYDRVLYSYVKQDLSELAKDSLTPFYYSIMTIDTHSPNGYLSADCDSLYATSYENAIACADAHFDEFFQWLKEQPFFANTTVVVMGDHLTMNNAFFDGKGPRTIYNAFVNSAVQPQRSDHRDFYQMDYFPTLLASIGFKIEGERLGLGVNLFSGEKTLYEEYGYDKVNEELNCYSSFYDEHFLY